MFFSKELENWKNHVPSWIVDILQGLYFWTCILEITEKRKEGEEGDKEEK